MIDPYLHEAAYRGRHAIERLGTVHIVLCGAGALGSLMADNLVRHGAHQLTAIDSDRIEIHNVGTQIYGQEDIGAFKVEVLRSHCFRCTGVEITIHAKRLDENNIRKFLKGADLVIDTFDNSSSRKIVTEYCRDHSMPCLHLGMNQDYGEVRWNETYRVPGDVVAGDVCDYPLARNLILLVVAAGTESVLRRLLENHQENYSITLRDLKITIE